MPYENLIQIEGQEETRQKKARTSTPRLKGRGCESCSLDKIKGVKKIFGKVKGKRLFVWVQSPGSRENREEKELVGPAGEFLWSEMSAAGITRDMCDIQNVVRCFPASWDDGELRMRDPSKGEIHCCSLYTDQAIEKAQRKGRVRVHLVFGLVAAKALLGREYRKERKVFWSEKLQGKVICLAHPAYFIRQGGSNAPQSALAEFRKLLKLGAKLGKISSSKYGYLEEQNYVGITTSKATCTAYNDIRRQAKRGHRVSADVEEGLLDDRGRATRDGSGKRALLVCGFSARPGTSYVFPIAHPDAPVTRKIRKLCGRLVQKLLRNRQIKKVMHHGCYDVTAAKDLQGWKVRGFDYDTEFGEYFTYPDRYAFGLAAIADSRFPQFVGYKEIVVPETLTASFKEKYGKVVDGKWTTKLDSSQLFELARKNRGSLNYALLPWKKMVLYNGADNDLQKRIELSTDGSAPPALMRVYRDASFVLAQMEQEGPLLDYKHHAKLESIYPALEKMYRRKIYKTVLKVARKTSRSLLLKYFKSDNPKEVAKNFNPNNPKKVSDFMYKVLRLPVLGETPSADKETMTLLSEYHPFPKYVSEFRRLTKITGTYLAGFLRSANAWGGKLRTKWWLTGTRTGRLSSGGGREKDKDNTFVNLQNIHGDPLLQCLLVSDLHWMAVYQYWKDHGPFKSMEDIPDWILDTYVFLGFDHAQMELRVLAQKSGDKVLMKLFSVQQELKKIDGKVICINCRQEPKECGCGDPHSLVGHELTGWKVSVIKTDERIRRVVKNMQFGIVFGLNEDNLYDYMVAKGAYKALGPNPTDKEIRQVEKDKEETRRFHRKYFRRFAGVKRMIDNDRAFTEHHGRVETLFGFRRKLDVSPNADNKGGYWGNIAINTPIQGTAHQLMLMGLIPLKRKAKKYAKKLKRIHMEIHDAVYFGVRLRHMLEGAVLGQKMLEKESVGIAKREFKLKWKVPLKAEPKAGYRFGCIVKLKSEDTIVSFLNRWCEANKAVQKSLRKELKKVAA